MKKVIFGLIVFAWFSIAASAQTVAFTNVNVIPLDKERVLQNQTVLVRNGIITAIGKNVKIPNDALKVDGKGKYLIPGLMDMHTHLLSDGDEYPDSIAEDELKVMIANGVTTIRLMIGTKEQLVLRERAAKGEIVAPRIYAASPHLTGKKQGNDFVVVSEDQAREAVRQSKAAGYDFIKITTFIDAKVYEAAIDEAAKQNIKVVGHADSRFVGVERALKAKQQIEHLDGYMEMLLKTDAPMKGSISDLYIYQPKNWESLDYIDESKIAELAKRTVAANPFVNPTQHFMKNAFGLARSEDAIRAQPDFRFYPKKVQESWLNYLKKTPINQISLEKRARWIEIRNKLIKAIHDAGGRIMTGSDSPEFLFLYGFSMHRELKALSEAGLSNYAVLEAATRNPAEFFGTLEKVGTIEKGKRADLILLDANPLENISNTEKRAGVMVKGTYYAQSELNRWLDEIAPRIAGSHIEKTSDQESAGEVADKLFEAMRAKNPEAIRALFLENGQLTALDKPRSGEDFSTTRNFSADAFAKMISEAKGGEFIEKMPEKEVKIYGDAAVVSGRYTFHVGEKFSHCGMNAFHLLRTEKGWRIANATSTLETANCQAKTDNSSAENKDALAAVDKLFELMAAHKPEEIIALHTPESQLTALIKDKDNKNKIENLTREAFSKFFAVKRAELSEKMHDTQIFVSGDLALVYGRYIFTVNNKLAHCGMNAFHLIRTAEGWKLGNSISTIEPVGCTEKEKAMVAPAPAANQK